MNNKKVRVLHGMSEVAGQGSYSVSGLKEIGIDTTMAVWRRNPFGYPVDIDMGIKKEKLRNPIYALMTGFRMLTFAIISIRKYNVFHFHFSHSLLPFGLDLPFLKLMKKRFVMEYHGDDIRYFYHRVKPYYYPLDELVIRSKRAKRTNDRILKYVDTVITHDEELRNHIPHNNLYITPLRMNPDIFVPLYPEVNKKRITIVHAPSNYILKGSKYVIASIEELKKKYDIEFILVEKKTQQEAFEIYKKADIIIDQFYAETYGVFALEAMALGKPVVAYISDRIKKTFPESMPIVSATIDSLTKELEVLVKNGDLRNELGKAGRKYVEDYHDYRKVAQVQLDIYRNRIKPMSTLESFEYTKKKVIKEKCVE